MLYPKKAGCSARNEEIWLRPRCGILRCPELQVQGRSPEESRGSVGRDDEERVKMFDEPKVAFGIFGRETERTVGNVWMLQWEDNSIKECERENGGG